MDCVGHYARPDLLQLSLNAQPWSVVQAASPTVDRSSTEPSELEELHSPYMVVEQ
jgi:hypothetical protein